MTHTPGPWKAVPNPMRSDGYFVVRDGAPQYYVGVADLSGKPIEQLPPAVIPMQVPEADAHLIAAAPDLLAACRAFVIAHEQSLQLEKTDVALRLARAAILKAEGKAGQA